jgi:hypothetical protein
MFCLCYTLWIWSITCRIYTQYVVAKLWHNQLFETRTFHLSTFQPFNLPILQPYNGAKIPIYQFSNIRLLNRLNPELDP